jgi:site-specific recombinase XerD
VLELARMVDDEELAERQAGDNAGLNPEGVQPVSCHDLRHSFVPRLISKGIDPVTVAGPRA